MRQQMRFTVAVVMGLLLLSVPALAYTIVMKDGSRMLAKDYRVEGPGRYKTMTLKPHEFIRRFLMHVLPKGFHRIRHYGLLANGNRLANVERARELLGTSFHAPEQDNDQEPEGSPANLPSCPCCGGQMIVIETFQPDCKPKHTPQRAPPSQPGGAS